MGRLEDILSLSECAVCGDRRQPGETWFVITENYWEDRLKVWRWNQKMAAEETAHSVCSQGHVRELVVHWMTTGCLHYPFASVPFGPQSRTSRLAPWADEDRESETPRILLGELAVDRDGIARVLRENPLSLNAVLDELTIALENEVLQEGEAEREEELFLALRTV